MTTANPYPGVNPHLNSLLQQKNGGWHIFHTYFLTNMADWLNRIFPDYYYAAPEESLQISIYDIQTFPPQLRQSWTKPDVLISKTDTPAIAITAANTHAPTLTLPVWVKDEPDNVTGVVIYTANEQAVTRIELLSPANKPGGSHYGQYLEKRQETLHSGLCLVEIDFLHERPPIIPLLPDYTTGDTQAFPYYVLVTDPRPTVKTGNTAFFGIGVMDRLPVIAVPLAGSDSVGLDIGAVYDTTFNKRPFPQRVNITQPPLRFDAYSPLDKQRIIRHMATLADTHE